METDSLNVKVLERDKIALRRLAAIEGEAMSVVLRRLIRQEARARGLLGGEPDGGIAAGGQADGQQQR